MEIRENLELMKRARMGPDGKRLDKPKHGGRKVFFRRLWCRIQGIPIDEASEGKGKKKRYRKPGVKPKKKMKSEEEEDEEEDDDSDEEEEDEEESQSVKKTKKSSAASSGDETETESSEGESDDEDGKPAATKKNGSKKKQSPWFDGVSVSLNMMTRIGCQNYNVFQGVI